MVDRVDDVSEDLRKIAEALAPYFKAGVGGVPQPRPDLHADHDKRLTKLEAENIRLCGVVEGIQKTLAGLTDIDQRLTEMQASMREERARDEARRETNAQRNEWLKWALPIAAGAAGFIVSQSGLLGG